MEANYFLYCITQLHEGKFAPHECKTAEARLALKILRMLGGIMSEQKPIYKAEDLNFSDLRVQNWQAVYGDLKEQCNAAWKVYDDAIEANEPFAEITRLGKFAEELEDVKKTAWLELQTAKRDFLRMRGEAE